MKVKHTFLALGSTLALAAIPLAAGAENSPASSSAKSSSSTQSSQLQSGQQIDQQTGSSRASMGSTTTGNGAASAGTATTAKQFVTTTARSNQLEIELGQLAAQKASDEKVQELGQQMVQHHRQVNEKLNSIASKKNIEVPQSLSEQDRGELATFRELSGSEFDRRYTSRLVEQHQKDIKSFEQQVNQGGDPEIREFARNTLPTLREHLQEAQQLQQNLKS